jgi:predicted MFS family arabinose efflux permease
MPGSGKLGSDVVHPVGDHACAVKRLIEHVGGERRAWAIGLLALSLAISDADLSNIGAVAGLLETHLHISAVEVGMLATVTAVVGALATIPVGGLTDRVRRVPLLAGSVVLWAGAMVMGAVSGSYLMLLLSRVVLGAVTATSGPTLASLTGDLFAPGERAKVYGWIESGEMAGAAGGLVGGGVIAGLLSWRASFVALAIPALLLALGLWRKLPEPPRGGAGRLEPADAVAGDGAQGDADPPDEALRAAVRAQDLEGVEDHVLDEEPARMSLLAAVRYVLSVPTNRVLIVASALGYFFFTGVQTFAVVLVEQQFGVGQTLASLLIGLAALGAVMGVLVGGRVADWRVSHGHVSARVTVAAACYAVACAGLVPALIAPSLLIGIPLYFLGTGAITAANPPLDAARLDVIPSRLWGRAEGVRTLLRQAATAAAPLVFGIVAELLGTGGRINLLGAGSGSSRGNMQGAFLVMLGALGLSGVVLAIGRRHFAQDVAAAARSEEKIQRRRGETPA